MPEQTLSPEQILDGRPRLSTEDQFAFRCGNDLDCYGKCCRDVSIVLTPYDLLRLKRAKRMDSTEFLENYTLPLADSRQGFPVLILRMNSETKQCPFVSERGCEVYADRPWACRMYPLGAATPKKPTPTEQPFYFVVREELCHGHGQGEPRSVRQWVTEQGIEEYEMMGLPFQALTLHDFWKRETPLTPEQVGMFYMACYDLDRFRRFVFESRFLGLFEVDEARVEALRSDDEELLEFGVHWLRFCLFGEKTMKIRRGILEAKRAAAMQAGATSAEGI